MQRRLEIEDPQAPLAVDAAEAVRAPLGDPLPAGLGDPREVFAERDLVAGGAHRGEAVMAHAADVVASDVALAVDVCRPAPEVLARHMRPRELQSLVPAVVPRAEAGEQSTIEGADRMQVGLGSLEGRRIGVEDVGRDLDRVGGHSQPGVLARDHERHAAVSFTGAQGAPSPSIRVMKASSPEISPAATRTPRKAEA